MAEIECNLAKVVMSESRDHQVIVLKEKDGSRRFPIIIGFFEVFAIHRFIHNEIPPRPLTHELVGNILRSLDAGIEKVVVNDLKDMTFHAKIVLSQNGRNVEVDSRPSDAIALAVQTGASIFVEEHVLEEAAGDYSE